MTNSRKQPVYASMYVCRMCGTTYIGAENISEADAKGGVITLTTYPSFYPTGSPSIYPTGSGIGIHKHEIHHCGDGSIGFSDFQGFKKMV